MSWGWRRADLAWWQNWPGWFGSSVPGRLRESSGTCDDLMVQVTHVAADLMVQVTHVLVAVPNHIKVW